MRSSLNRLILLGFICQGLSWESYVPVLLFTLLWIFCLRIPRPIRINSAGESLAICAGSIVAYLLGRVLGVGTHFFIGNGLLALQAIRLMRPLTERERVFAFLIALFHVGVGCSVVLDFRFILVLGAAVVLLPKTLIELQAPEPGGSNAILGRVQWALIICTMFAFFLLFPRATVNSPIRSNARSADDGTLADSFIDSTRSGPRLSGRVLLQIQGEKVGYLRCLTLSQFDGVNWTAERTASMRRIRYASDEDLPKYDHRQVRVKNAAFLGRLLPTDGHVVQLRGNFFNFPLENAHGGIECGSMWNTSNNRYEYWSGAHPRIEILTQRQKNLYTSVPTSSARLSDWLDDRLAGVSQPLDQARTLQKYFRENFKYNLGAPQLSRLGPLEDFIFNQREGHCERFASTLAALLRMKGIPSRVVIGYVPSGRDWISGWLTVRFKDAHSWTEAYFPEQGWISFDATPYTTVHRPGLNLSDRLEELDFAWYAHVVNFDGFAQSQLFNTTGESFVMAGNWLKENALLILLLALVPLAGVLAWKGRFLWRRLRSGPGSSSAVVTARYYGRMIRRLERIGYAKLPQQTPFEFLTSLHQTRFADDAGLITRHFCSMRYGHRELTPEDENEIQRALRRICANE